MPGRNTHWVFKDKDLRRLLKKKELRLEESEWQSEVLLPYCSSRGCVCSVSSPECDCKDLDWDVKSCYNDFN